MLKRPDKGIKFGTLDRPLVLDGQVREQVKNGAENLHLVLELQQPGAQQGQAVEGDKAFQRLLVSRLLENKNKTKKERKKNTNSLTNPVAVKK